MTPRVLIAGIGNIFLGDDAFGVEVVKRLLTMGWPESVRVTDFGIRGLDLAYAMLEGYEAVIMVDASPRGEAPGTLYVIEPDAPAGSPQADDPLLQTHSLDPVNVLRLVAAMGGTLPKLLLVACEPTPLSESDDYGEMLMEMSPSARRAVDAAIPMIRSLVAELINEPLRACAS